MRINFIEILGMALFTCKMVFYVIIWAVGLHYLSTTRYIDVQIWLAIVGIVGGIIWMFLPILKQRKSEESRT